MRAPACGMCEDGPTLLYDHVSPHRARVPLAPALLVVHHQAVRRVRRAGGAFQEAARGVLLGFGPDDSVKVWPRLNFHDGGVSATFRCSRREPSSLQVDGGLPLLVPPLLGHHPPLPPPPLPLAGGWAQVESVIG